MRHIFYSILLIMAIVSLLSGCSSDSYTSPDPARGAFSVTAKQMDYQPWGAAVALLKDGTVLVCGGHYDEHRNKAFITNPNDGSVTPVGPMNDARSFHSATTLADGTVLITGGTGNNSILGTAELYNPADRTFRRIASMSGGRSDHTATMLQNERVLLAGGTRMTDPSTQIFLDSAELYDPKTGQFTPVANAMTNTRIGHVAALLKSGKVLVAAGASNKTGTSLGTADLYDPATNSFTRTGDMLDTRWSPAAAPLADGRVLVTGGYRGNGGIGKNLTLKTSEIYDPATGTFTSGPTMSSARLRHLMLPLSNGDIMIAGGSLVPYGSGPTLATEWYRAASNSFETGPRLAAGRDYSSGAVLSGDRVLIAGIHSAAEIYTPGASQFMTLGGLTQARGGHSVTLLPDGKVLIAGGIDTEGYRLATAELFDPVTGLTRRLNTAMNQARTLHTATLLANGKVLIVAGGSDSGELYDPATETFTLVPNRLPLSIAGQTAVTLKDGRILLAGGYDYDNEYWVSVNIATIYDPGTNRFTQTGSMVSPRRMHCATLLNDGRVLVAGGKDATDYDTAELYNPITGAWTATAGKLGVMRSAASATLLTSGKVLIAGGHYGEGVDTVILDSAELFDAATGTFSTLDAKLVSVSSGHSTAMLQDGRLFIMGGSADVQVFDQLSQTFFKLASPMAQRESPPLAVLKDGRVLASGAVDRKSSALNSSIELFTP